MAERRKSPGVSEITTPLLIQLDDRERAALEQVRAEGFPTASLAAMARKLIRDDLVRMGLLPLPGSNRSKGAKKTARLG